MHPAKWNVWHIIIPIIPLPYLLHAICDMGINGWSKNLKNYYIIINCLVDTGSKFAMKVNKDLKYWPGKYPNNTFYFHFARLLFITLSLTWLYHCTFIMTLTPFVWLNRIIYVLETLPRGKKQFLVLFKKCHEWIQAKYLFHLVSLCVRI